MHESKLGLRFRLNIYVISEEVESESETGSDLERE